MKAISTVGAAEADVGGVEVPDRHVVDHSPVGEITVIPPLTRVVPMQTLPAGVDREAVERLSAAAGRRQQAAAVGSRGPGSRRTFFTGPARCQPNDQARSLGLGDVPPPVAGGDMPTPLGWLRG